MTEPDEALLWARERAKGRMETPNSLYRDIRAEIDAGKYDGELADEAHAYRAGAAASEARIKALEEALRDALPQLEGCFWHHTWYSERPREPEYLVNIRALLKEADQ